MCVLGMKYDSLRVSESMMVNNGSLIKQGTR